MHEATSSQAAWWLIGNVAMVTSMLLALSEAPFGARWLIPALAFANIASITAGPGRGGGWGWECEIARKAGRRTRTSPKLCFQSG